MPSMAQRLAVLLVLASVVAVALADMPTAETAKYKEHEKHQKEPKHDKYEKYNSYKPDGYKPDGYKPDSYKPDYKPDYMPEGYKSGYKSGYEHEHYGEKPYGEHGYTGKPYEHYGGEHSHGYEPEGYGYEHAEMSPFDGGYWGGMSGRQIIHLQTVYGEALVNITERRVSRREAPNSQCAPDQLANCDQDYAVLCAKRHHEPTKSDSYGSDYAAKQYGPIFQTPPVQPVAIGKGYVTFEFDAQNEPLASINLVQFNKHQTGYKIADVNGFINFFAGSNECHPLLGPMTKVEYNAHRVPVYIIFGKVSLPVDPAILLPLGGLGYINGKKGAKASVQSVKETDDYKTTDQGSKYKVEGDHIYVQSKKDATIYCGIAVVARGPVTLTAPIPDSTPTATQLYTGTIEWPIAWTDLITTLPLLIGDDVERRRSISFDFGAFLGPIVGEIVEVYLTETIDRVAAVCEANDDIPWIHPGSITLDVNPTMS